VESLLENSRDVLGVPDTLKIIHFKIIMWGQQLKTGLRHMYQEANGDKIGLTIPIGIVTSLLTPPCILRMLERMENGD